MKTFFPRYGLLAVMLLFTIPVFSGSLEETLSAKIDIVVAKDGTGDF